MGNKEVITNEEVLQKKDKIKTTKHRYDPCEQVYVAEFRNVRENKGYTKIENQYKFVPTEEKIEKVIITIESGSKVIRYKMKNKAGSLFDEEDVCATYKDAVKLCDERNK